MKTNKQWLMAVALLAGLAFLLNGSTRAIAQDEGDDQDPPGRVARLSFADGQVSFQPAGEGDWVTATPNRPMVTGDNLWADESSRAEVHIGSTAMRLSDQTGITFLELTDRVTQIRLAQGALFIRVRHVDDEDNYEVDTPNLSFRVVQPGEYRLDVSPDGDRTTVSVWQGRGHVTGGGSSYTVVADQRATFTGSDELQFDVEQVRGRDGFDQWAFERDQREDHSDSANYVSREMTGYEDLDEYGRWSYVAGYGECWAPVGVASGWAPYRNGHWAWVAPYGWTWVADEPWGFAPFHYGRWASVGGGWFWVPGPVVVRPIWAPALVAWVGGGGWGVSVGAGVGWFPLGPGEVFVPGYRVSRGYVNQVNVTNTTVNITKITNVYNTTVINNTTNNTTVNRVNYVNAHVTGGVTAVSRDTFVNARPVASHLVHVEPKDIESAPMGHMAPVEPIRTSTIGAGRPTTVKPPVAVMNRQVVAQHEPPAVPPTFEQRKAQAGGHLNQPPPVIREAAPQPRAGGSNNVGTTPPPAHQQDGFKPFAPPNHSNPGQAQGRPDVATGGNNGSANHAPPSKTSIYDQPKNDHPKNEGNQGNPNGAANHGQRTSVFDQPRNNGNPENQNPPHEVNHPLVKPTPQVQERSPEQERGVEQKIHNWEQNRPSAPPAPPEQRGAPPAPHVTPPASHTEPHAEAPKQKGH